MEHAADRPTRNPPRMLRKLVAVAAVAALATAAASPVARSATGTRHASLSALESGVLQQLNQIRAEHGLAALRASPSLDASAAQHTKEMGVDGYFAHNSFDGTAFWKRIQRWYDSTDYGYWSVGENLLWSSPDVDASAALKLWMSSPDHRANILAPRWREIGISAMHFTAAPGAFRDKPVTIITTDFGVRR